MARIMSCQKTSKQVFQMRKERKNIFRALFRDPFQPFLQNDGNDRSYSYIVQKRGSKRVIKIAHGPMVRITGRI